jgi:hypothetical protein
MAQVLALIMKNFSEYCAALAALGLWMDDSLLLETGDQLLLETGDLLELE